MQKKNKTKQKQKRKTKQNKIKQNKQINARHRSDDVIGVHALSQKVLIGEEEDTQG